MVSPSTSNSRPLTRSLSGHFTSNAADADIIIRSRDGVEFPTNLSILTRASPVFRDMEVVARVETGQQLVELPEDGLTLSRLLRWLDVRFVPLIDNLDDLSMIIHPVKKYLMESVRARLLGVLRTKLQMPPSADCFRLWAMAVRLGDQALAAAAARLSVRFSAEDRTFSEDYEDILASSVVKLDAYRNEVRRAVVSLAKLQRGDSQIHQIAFWMDNLTVKPLDPTETYDFAHEMDESDHNRDVCPWRPLIDPDEYNYHEWHDFTHYRKWFWLYLERLPDELAKCPSKETISGIPLFAQDSLLLASQCEPCSKIAFSKLVEFNKQFGDKIEDTIYQVKVPIFCET